MTCPSTIARSSCCASTSTCRSRRSAQILDIPIGTVKSRINRGLGALRASMAADPEAARRIRPGGLGMNDDARLERIFSDALAGIRAVARPRPASG